ncbi:hypothetical protein LguiA_025279 [Lonicera macranthoides]
MRGPKWEKYGLKKGAWSAEEDQKLVAYIKRYGLWNWSEIPKHAGLSRTGKSCRLRWVNYLCPGIKHGKITKEEEDTILELHQTLGNRWSAIASKLPGRTDNEIKNYWHTHLKKRVEDNTPAQKTKPQELQTSISKTQLQILHFDSTDHIVLNAPKSSNSEGSLITVPMSPHISMSDCTPSSSRGLDFGVDEEQKTEVNIIEQNGDLQKFWEELPFLCQDLYMEDEIAAFMDPKVLPCTYNNMHEYWSNLLLQADMNGMEEPNSDFF